MFETPGGYDSTSSTSSSSATAIAEAPLAVHTERPKPIVVTGASGFVGMHLCRILAESGWRMRALVRNGGKAASRLGHMPVELKIGDIRDPDYVRRAMEGAGAVVHLAAIAVERGGDSYEQVNAEATRVVVEAAVAAGVDRFVHMSQNGSDSRSPYPFLRSKGIAQDIVTSSALRWTVLRPSVIFGPEDEFVNVLGRLVRLTPGVLPLPGGGTTQFQPIWVDDVATVARMALDDDSTVGSMYALGGPIPLTLRQMAERILAAMQAHRQIVSLPIAAARPLIALAEKLLPNPPVTTSLLDLLAVNNVVPDNAITSKFGIIPTAFAPEELRYLRRITASEALRSLFSSIANEPLLVDRFLITSERDETPYRTSQDHDRAKNQ